MTKKTNVQIAKAVNEELMQATFIVMVPEVTDLQGDITSEEEVRKACTNYNLFCRKANLFHMGATDTFSVIESYISPVDFTLGEREVTKGTWLATIQVNDTDLWTLIKSGEVSGLSIGAMASVETLEE